MFALSLGRGDAMHKNMDYIMLSHSSVWRYIVLRLSTWGRGRAMWGGRTGSLHFSVSVSLGRTRNFSQTFGASQTDRPWRSGCSRTLDIAAAETHQSRRFNDHDTSEWTCAEKGVLMWAKASRLMEVVDAALLAMNECVGVWEGFKQLLQTDQDQIYYTCMWRQCVWILNEDWKRNLSRLFALCCTDT